MFLTRRMCPVLLLLCCLTVMGCVERAPQKRAETKEHSSGNTVPDSKKPEQRNPSIPNPEDSVPLRLLQQTVTAYQTAKTYSDHGEVCIIGKMSDPNEEPAHWACTVCFERPGKLRLEINEGKFVSGGKNCFAQIRSMPEQVLYFRTPERWTLETIFQDTHLDRAMNLGIPETILRFAPQLILLFAENPLRTLLPEGASAELLEPQRIGDIVCDLIRVEHRQNSWILWLNRQNRALLRFDYLVEGLAVPPGVESIRLIRIDMPDACFDADVSKEAFLMEQPRNARQVSEFLPPDMPELSAQQQETHRQQLRAMTENGVFAVPLPLPLSEPFANRTLAPAPVKIPKTFQLKEQWKLALTGTENITVCQQGILVPCEGNLLAKIDAAGKIIQKIQPKGFQEDELLTRIRTATDETGKMYIGVSSVSGQTVHLFDEKFTPLPQTSTAAPVYEKQTVVSDFQFVKFPNGTFAVLTGLLSLNIGESDILRLTALDGKELWRDNSVHSPFLVHSYTFDGKQGLLVLSVQERQSLLLNYDIQGQKLGALPLAEGREILWFSVAGVNNAKDFSVCVIHSDAEGKDVRISGLSIAGKTLWEHSLPSGEYQKPIDQIITGDLLGDAALERLVPLPDGTVFIFAHDGTLLDELSFGRFLTGLAVIKNGLETLFIVADTASVTAYTVSPKGKKAFSR